MTLPSHSGYPAGEGHPAPPNLSRSGPEPWRFGAAALIVAIVVTAIWLWGRPRHEPVGVLSAVTAEAWTAGQPPGGFDVVDVPPEVALRLADPDTIAGNMVTHDVPVGTFVTPALLGSPDDTGGALTALRFAADTSAWPDPGPRAGSRAVVATALGGCAITETTLVGGSDGAVVVRVDAAGAARLAGAASIEGLVVWPAPPDGWPPCPPRRYSDEPRPAYGAVTPTFNPTGG